MKKLPILYYHDIVPDGEGYSYQKLALSHFEAQMKYLRDNGYHALLFPELQGPIPDRSVIVSFDDGFRSVYEAAAPIMERYGIRGNVYLPTAYIGQNDRFMDWDMVRELYQSGRWYFAAHTHRHIDIRTLDRQGAREELEASHALFEERLGYIPTVFCMPYGTFDAKSLATVRETGRYGMMLGSFYGFAAVGGAKNAALPRIGISDDDTLGVFADKLRGRMNWKGPLQRARLLLANLRGNRITEYAY